MENNQESVFVDDIFQWPIGIINNFDVWDYIFENYLTSAKDQSNLLMASSQYFGPLLEQRKWKWMFGEVLHILHAHKYLALDISKADLLKYRGLSKSCRESLDQSLQFKNPCYENLDGFYHDILSPFHACWIEKPSRDVIHQRNERIASRIRNENLTSDTSLRVPCGSLTFADEGSYQDDHHRNSQLILSTVGAKIYHFRYILMSLPWTLGDSYLFLSEALGLMPNLRTLEVISLLDEGSQSLNDVSTLLQSHPLPDLNHLTVLKLRDFPAIIVDALLQKYAVKLEKLSIEFGIKRRGDIYCYQNSLLSRATNLSQLSIGVMHNQACINRFFPFKSFLTLKCLSVCIEQCIESLLSSIFKDLCHTLSRHFRHSGCLRTINLFIRSGPITSIKNLRGRPTLDCGTVRLSLSSVKRLWICVQDVYLTSLDFYLGLRNLEELVVTMEKSRPDTVFRVQQMKLVDFWNQMDEDNVWQLMPKLETITVRFKEYEGPIESYKFSRPTSSAMC